MIGDVQGSHDLPFCSHQLSHCRIYHVFASIGQLNQNTTTIIGVILPARQSSLDEPVYAVGHCPRGNEGFSEQLPR